MTSKERVLSAFNKLEVDRYPVINPTSIATVESMQYANAYFPNAHIDGKKMSDLAIAGHKLIGFDTVMPYFSVQLEASAFGCEVDWGTKDMMPRIVKNAFTSIDEFKKPKNIFKHKNIKEYLECLKILKKKSKDEYAIIGKVIGPLTLAYHLFGAQNFLLEFVIRPEYTKQILEELMTLSINFAEEQFNAGADIVTWADHATRDLISAKGYEQLLFPIHVKANQLLNKSGPVILHICGNVKDRMHLITRTGFECFHIDSRNHLKEAADICKDRILLTGAINNPKTLVHGNKNYIRKEVEMIINSGIKIISPECAIPTRVSNENLKGIVSAAHEKIPK